MASLTTPVQGWPIPADSDAPAVAADMRLLGTALDATAKRLSGLASARPAAASTPVDTIYFATDTGIYSICTGAAWGTMLVAGAWAALTLGSGVAASGSETPSARLEGDVVRLKGALANTTGAAIALGSSLATMPAGMNPPKQRNLTPTVNSGTLNGSGALDVTTGGVLQNPSWAWSSAGVLPLDGLSYTLT